MHFLFESIERHANENPSQTAVADARTSLSWASLRNAVGNCRAMLPAKERSLGLLAPNGCEYVVALLAAAAEGKTLVPLPPFFSDTQLAKIMADARIGQVLVTDETAERAARLNLQYRSVKADIGDCLWRAPAPGFQTIIYTSGSTGSPKGVRHTFLQIEAVVRGLASASQATAEDRYLSLLPLSMLLETICAVFLPLFCGAQVYLDARIAEQVAAGKVNGLARAIAEQEPTATVLVPQLLKAWLFEMKAMRMAPSPGLRFVAVGGARVTPALLDLAAQMGVPVFEGYGLSECCSVVTLNGVSECKRGTSGKPLPGIRIAIEDGEIVVDGPTLMDGYVGNTSLHRPWHTGDLGSIDQDGFLTVRGRKDNLIVTGFGRNVSPEWIETALLADPRIALAVVTGSAQSALHVVLVPTAFGEGWFGASAAKDVHCLLAALCIDLPDYAVPQTYQTISMADAIKAMLVTTNGRPIRCRVNDFVATSFHQPAAQ
ncbi:MULTISPECIES: AMP-binding protein [unclassified Rhizobium]|uniref:AMP-binding protein n=1 Tax=unclassified Rhizobium TaxID=2613769 RepID=UPI00380B8F51